MKPLDPRYLLPGSRVKYNDTPGGRGVTEAATLAYAFILYTKQWHWLTNVGVL